MNLNIPNVDPFILGLIKQHQAEHGHKNQRESVECLIKKAMIEYKEIHDFQMMIEKEMLEGKRDENGKMFLCPNCQSDNIDFHIDKKLSFDWNCFSCGYEWITTTSGSKLFRRENKPQR